MSDSAASDVSTATPAEINEDQAAIRDYLASGLYAAAEDSRKRAQRQHVGDTEWNWEHQPLENFFKGLGGVAALLIATAGALPFAIKQLENWSRPEFWVMVPTIMTILFPPVVGFCFATVIPLFWYRSIILRFIVAGAAVLPGCVAFSQSMLWAEMSVPSDFWIAFSLCMSAQFIAAAAVAVSVQMWSRWTLSHRGDVSEVAPPTGLRSMLELTVVVAIACAVLFDQSFADYLPGVMFFGGMGFLTSLAVIGALIGYLRRERPSWKTFLITLALAQTSSTACAAFFAALEFGIESLQWNVGLILGVSLWGTTMFLLLGGLHLYWLKRSGWVCLRRGAASP